MSESVVFPAPASAAALPTPLVVVDLVWPDQSNHHGTLFGGAALAMLDRLAFIMGSKALRGAVVTAAVGRLDFASPAPAGFAVECQARVLQRGRRSATVEASLMAEDLLSGERVHCLRGEFVMVRQAGTEPATAIAPDAAGGPGDGVPTAGWARVAEIVFPGHANHRGVLHGGPAMAWMAKAGFVAATRQARRSVVMAASERMDFVAPAVVGDVVEVTARVAGTGQRSVRVQVELWAESPVTGARHRCTSAELVYVAVDA